MSTTVNPTCQAWTSLPQRGVGVYFLPVSGWGRRGTDQQNKLPQVTSWKQGSQLTAGNAVCPGNRQAPRHRRGTVLGSVDIHGL